MSLTLYYHPLASYCHKALIALYENGTPFRPRLVDLGDPADRAAFASVWPPAKFPVLRDEAVGRTVPESSIIIEYIDTHYPGAARLIPTELEAALEVRLLDRLFDLYVHDPMQRIVADRLRPAGKADAYGVEEARTKLVFMYGVLEERIADREWAAGNRFTLADCAAAPALFYGDKVAPFRAEHPKLSAYFDRLLARPSYARVLNEAEPYMHMFPD